MWLYKEGPYRLSKERPERYVIMCMAIQGGAVPAGCRERPERYVIMCVAIQGGAVQAEQRAAREVCYNVYGYTRRGPTGWAKSG